MLKYVSTDKLKDIFGGCMKRIIALCTITLILTDCHEEEAARTSTEKASSTNQQTTPTVEMEFIQSNPKEIKPQHKQIADENIQQLKKEISIEVASKIPKVKPITSKYEYVDTVREYSKEMDRVINTMTVYDNKKDVEQQLTKVKNIVVKYEVKVQTAKELPQIKKVDAEVKKANDKYIQSFGKIASAITTKDIALKEDGYTDFSKGNTYFNRAYYGVQSIEDNVQMEAMVEPDTTNQSPTSESSSLEIVVYTANGSEALPMSDSAEDKKSALPK